MDTAGTRIPPPAGIKKTGQKKHPHKYCNRRQGLSNWKSKTYRSQKTLLTKKVDSELKDVPDDLREIFKAWPNTPKHIKQTILTLVSSI